MKPERTKELRKKKFENESTQISEKRINPKENTNCDKRYENAKEIRYTSLPRRHTNTLLQRAQSFATAESSIYLSKFKATRDWVFQHSIGKNLGIDRGHPDRKLEHRVGLQRSESLRPLTQCDQVNSFKRSSCSGVYEDLYSLWEQCGREKTKDDWYRWLEDTGNPLKVDNQRYENNNDIQYELWSICVPLFTI